MKAFFNETNLGKQAMKEEETNHKIGIKTRKYVISLVVDFIGEIFGIGAEAKLIKMTCCELIEIFPSLRCAPSEMGGIVSQYLSLFFSLHNNIFNFIAGFALQSEKKFWFYLQHNQLPKTKT